LTAFSKEQWQTHEKELKTIGTKNGTMFGKQTSAIDHERRKVFV